jgi:protein-tyrosine phosphatase-like protein
VQHGIEMDQQFARLVDSLAERFAGVHERDTVARVVGETRARLEPGARVTTYLPILAARHAVDLLAGRETPAGPRLAAPNAVPDHRAVGGHDPAARLTLLATRPGANEVAFGA